MTRLPHVVDVNPAGPGALAFEECIEQWWSTRTTMAAVAARGFRVTVVLRVAHGPVRRHHRDGLEYLGVPDDRHGLRTALEVRRLRPDLVHVDGFGFPVRTLALHALNRRVPMLVQHHGEPPAPPGTRAAWAQRRVGRVLAGALFTGAGSGATAPWVAAGVLRATAPCYEVLETLIDWSPLEKGVARSQCGMHGDPAVLWVGRLERPKDPVTLLRAMEPLSAAHPGLHLWFVTPGGSGRAEFEAAVARSRLSDRVSVVGPVERSIMPAWYSAADGFCTTSHAEGSGYALLEALTIGVPVIVASDLPSHRAILGTHGPCGPPPGSVAEFTEALRIAFSPSPTRAPPGSVPVASADEQLAAVYDRLTRRDSHRDPCDFTVD